MKKSEIAKNYFSTTFNCSQSVLASFGKDYGLTEDLSLKISCAFGGGMARQQMTCGVVTGALMAIGLAFGRGAGDPQANTLTTYDKTKEFFTEFRKRHGSIICKELLQGLDMNNPEDKIKIDELKLFQNVCMKYVQDAVEISERIINGD